MWLAAKAKLSIVDTRANGKENTTLDYEAGANHLGRRSVGKDRPATPPTFDTHYNTQKRRKTQAGFQKPGALLLLRSAAEKAAENTAENQKPKKA